MSAAPESFSPSPDTQAFLAGSHDLLINCLLYTSDAADEMSEVLLGGGGGGV